MGQPAAQGSPLERQCSPGAVGLLASSLECDRRAIKLISVYWLVVLASMALGASGSLLPDRAAGVLAGLSAVLAALIAVLYILASGWRDRGSSLRADYERFIFGLPPWTYGHNSDHGWEALAREFAKRRRKQFESLKSWFDVPEGLSAELQALTCQEQSLLYGAALRRRWSRILAIASVVLALEGPLAFRLLSPVQPLDWALILLPVTILPTFLVEYSQLRKHTTERLGLAARIAELKSQDSIQDLRLIVAVVTERMSSVRGSRVLVPNFYYRLTRRAAHTSLGISDG